MSQGTDDPYTEENLARATTTELVALLRQAETNALRSFVLEAMRESPWSEVGASVLSCAESPSSIVRVVARHEVTIEPEYRP